MRRTGRNRNSNDEATLSDSIAVNKTTSTLVQAANVDRIYFSISNDTSKDVWVKLQTASIDNDKKGIFLPRNSFWEMPPDNIYTGEISVISDSSSTNVHTMEY